MEARVIDTPTPDNTLAVQWAFGALVVLMYAWDRFRKPVPTRPTTTFWRYWSACFGYVVAMLALFVFLGGGIVSFDVRALAPLIGQIPDNITALPGPLLSAMLLTSVLPHMPMLARIDDAIKQWFWDVGNIPSEVRVLGTQLAAARYVYKLHEQSAQGVPAAFATYGADPLWLSEPVGSLKVRWSHCVALIAQLEQWKGERGYARYLEQNEAELKRLRSRLEGLSQWLNAGSLTELDSNSGSPSLARMRKTVGEDIASLWRDMCVFVASGVLNETWNDKQRRLVLMRLGFITLPDNARRLSSNDIVLVVGMVFIAVLFIPLAIRRFFVPDMLPMQLRVLVMVPIVYAIAIVAAIYPKSVWAFAGRTAGGPRPYAGYAVSGVIAAVAAFFVGVLFRFAFDSHGNVLQTLSLPGAFGKAWATSIERWPWLLMTFFASVSIAWAADDYSADGTSAPRWLRWAEATALAAVFTATQWLVTELLIAGATSADRAQQWIDAQPGMMITACVVGACLGFLVPSLYRAKIPHRHTRHATLEPLPA
jgi:hypothetical protein